MGAVGAAHVGVRQCSHRHTGSFKALPRRAPSLDRSSTTLVGHVNQMCHSTHTRTHLTAAGVPVVAQQSAAASETSSAQQQLDQQPDAQPLHREPSAAVPALKEWAVTCAALGAGQQTVVLRKGGIREPAFTPVARRFLLFPTSFHSGADLVKPGAAARFEEELQAEPKEQAVLSVGVAAEVTGAWTTADPDVVTALNAFHVWTPDYLDKRLRWRKAQPITVLELRCRRLRRPLQLRNAPELWGCFSWVSLPAGADAGGMAALLEGVAAALPDAEYAERQAALREAVLQLSGVEELSIPD